MTQLTDWLVLIHTPNLGASRFRSLLQEFLTPSGIRAAPRSVLRERGLSDDAIDHLRHPDADVVASDLDWLNGEGQTLITWQDDDYPPQLREIPTPPMALFVIGEPSTLWLPQLAVVGSRKPTPGGLNNAREFAAAAARSGLCITSGMALGIDGAAHEAALDCGGRTIAVAATGLDRVYPAKHRELAHRIAMGGALVSEFPPGVGPAKTHFPQRNRLISGLSLGTLVVEAGLRSGSLITAHLALDQSRDVFAIPGSIRNPVSRGCHHLIRQGARLVESAEEVIAELAPRARDFAHELRLELGVPAGTTTIEANLDDPNLADDDDYRRLLDAIGYDPVTVDALVETTGLTAEAVSSMLLILELSGLIEAAPGGSYCRTGEECP
jgi:DNA processing protein